MSHSDIGLNLSFVHRVTMLQALTTQLALLDGKSKGRAGTSYSDMPRQHREMLREQTVICLDLLMSDVRAERGLDELGRLGVDSLRPDNEEEA